VGNATDTLRDGNLILEATLGPAGYRFEPSAAGNSSGGDFASGRWIRADRAIEIHFRHSLGLVRYWIGLTSMSHRDLAEACDASGQASYPSYSTDPLDGFRHLRHDLEGFGGPFLSGAMTEEEMIRLVSDLKRRPRRRLP
jgi:hypothetical protein